eukprot:TRINITY_DN2362_c0_g2_i1.p1 TRINITY_DN2362_c0_g2~~TRINITY_DN2362_c0_g2_i1.p1  ORF type:complete len:271 (-),score=77.42 TRINITY_DN2362_c0_g2_i1:133-945(-)
MSEKRKIKTGPSIELPLKRKKDKTPKEEPEKQEKQENELGGQEFTDPENVMQQLQKGKKVKGEKKVAKKGTKKSSAPKLDPFSLQKDVVTLEGKDEYYDEHDENEGNLDEGSDEEEEVEEEEEEETTTGRRNKQNVMYIGHLPYGFFEKQLKGYFSQYGEVEKVVVRRNEFTKKSMGFGYIRFADEQVAKIAADSMNDYLLYGRRLKCEIARNPVGIFQEVPDLIPIDTRKLRREAQNKSKTPEQHEKRLKRLLGSEKKKKDLLKEIGYE